MIQAPNRSRHEAVFLYRKEHRAIWIALSGVLDGAAEMLRLSHPSWKSPFVGLSVPFHIELYCSGLDVTIDAP